ncbi:ImmA/IrrE family metallo-endopeptidase [Aquibacillus kalidii]|uniref:ImmA/IrrE family metallo-endopeptidase n=1 Tax=Aquibacillus kalidii TaxID=2762597 RepID=UPI0016491DC5|nr:ImmA/IrrE family metallo-endopeptidase [Aquibacillus kalidii]
MTNHHSLSPSEVKDIENKVRSKLGEKLKTNRVLREEVLNFIEQEATLLKYPIEDDELCAFVCKKKERLFVYINTNIPKEKQVFAAAHELYHIWYDTDRLNESELLRDSILENKTDDIREQKANLFAAILLVPTEVLKNELDSRNIQKNTLKLEDIVRLMSLFYAPYKTIIRRLFEIGFLSETELERFLEIPDRDPHNGVLLMRKRLQLSDSTQDRTREVFFEGLVDNAIVAFEKKRISEKKLRYLLSLVNNSPENLQLFQGSDIIDEDDLKDLMDDYGGDE